MTAHRNLAIATGLAAAIGFGAVPAIAQTAGTAPADGNGFRTEILRSDTWKPGYMKTDDGDYRMIVPETREEADAMPMRVLQSDEWQPGYMKGDDGSYYMLAPAEEARDESVRILRSDEWKPGYMKTDDGDYYMITPQPAGSQAAADPGKMQVVRSDAWQPGYLKTDDGDYYMLVPDRNRPRPDGDLAVIVDPAWTDAMKVYTLDQGQADRGSDMFIERTDAWSPGYMKDNNGDYYRLVHLRDSVPASALPDF